MKKIVNWCKKNYIVCIFGLLLILYFTGVLDDLLNMEGMVNDNKWEEIIMINKDGGGMRSKLQREFTSTVYGGNDMGDEKSNPTEKDPTHGNVRYIDEFNNNQESLILGGPSDDLLLKFGEVQEDKKISTWLNQKPEKNIYPSIRLTSNKVFQSGKEHIFILKARLPYGKGVWPAWWLSGNDGVEGPETMNSKWPTNGEIDIIELINELTEYKGVLHTCSNCVSKWTPGPYMTGDSPSPAMEGQDKSCWGENEGNGNGCFVDPVNGKSEMKLTKLGNNQVGGVFACHWKPGKTSDDYLGEIKFYYWEYDDETVSDEGGPLSLSPNPVTERWNKHLVSSVKYKKNNKSEKIDPGWSQCLNNKGERIENTCQFNNLRMIFNTTLCGDWAGNAYDNGGMDKCLKYITENPDKIENKKWNIDHIAAFSKNLTIG